MSWDRLDRIIEDRFDDSDLQDVPATHTYVCDVDSQADYDEARLTLNDWLDERVNELLGLDGACRDAGQGSHRIGRGRQGRRISRLHNFHPPSV